MFSFERTKPQTYALIWKGYEERYLAVFRCYENEIVVNDDPSTDAKLQSKRNPNIFMNDGNEKAAFLGPHLMHISCHGPVHLKLVNDSSEWNDVHSIPISDEFKFPLREFTLGFRKVDLRGLIMFDE